MLVIPDVFTPAEAWNLRQRLNNVAWVDGRESAQGMSADVKKNWQADREHATVIAVTNELLARLGQTAAFVSAALPQRIFPPCFNRYRVGESYGEHVDAAIMRLPKSNDILRSDLSLTVALSNQEDYEGGELRIVTEFGEQRIKLDVGSAVLYPSSSVHEVLPVTSGERVAAITWIQSLVSETQLRQTLHALDLSIQALSNAGTADRAELDRLHSVYHNLIRQFAAP